MNEFLNTVILYVGLALLALVIAGILIVATAKKDWREEQDDDRNNFEGNRIELD